MSERNVAVVDLTLLVVKVNVEQNYEQDFTLVKRGIRLLFSRNNKDRLPATYDKIYEACRSVVCSANKGNGVYENFKLELERCVGDLLRSLKDEEKQGVDYVIPFIEACQWFEKQVVGHDSLHMVWSTSDRIFKSLLQSVLAWFDMKYLRSRADLSSLR